MIPNLEPSQNICQLISAGGSSETGSKAKDASDGGEISDQNSAYGDCGDPSGVLGPLLRVVDEMMDAFDGFDRLVDKGLGKIPEIGNKIKDVIEKVGPTAALAL